VLLFSPEAVLVVPDRATDCTGVLAKGNRGTEGRLQLLSGHSRPTAAAQPAGELATRHQKEKSVR
jgi:hypothetical protein